MTNLDVIALVDDNAEEIDLYRRLLEDSGLPRVEAFSPQDFHQISGYNFLASLGEFGAVILDERLDELSGVSYSGLEVAQFLRALRPELPIYIMTNWPDDLAQSEEAGDVEDVISKSDFSQHPSKYSARILRATSRYEESLNEKAREFGALIDKKLNGLLDITSSERLSELQAEFERASAIEDTSQSLPRPEVDGESREVRLLNEVLSKLDNLKLS